LIAAVGNVVGFRAVAKKYPFYQGWRSNFADECFFRSERNSAAEWSTNFPQLTYAVKRPVPNQGKTSGSVSPIFAFAGNLFSSVSGILDLKSISVTWLIS